MEPVVYETTQRIPHYLGDRYGRINLPSLMSILIEISGEQTAMIGSTPVEELGLHWIIIQYELQMNRLPNTNETIKVRTYAKEYNRLFSYREFEVYDEEDNLLLHVMTVFALMDENRKLSRIPQEIAQGYGSTENRRIKRMPKPERPENLKKAMRKDYNVRYFDIDVNFHANNAMYFLWTLDALGDEFLATHNPIYGNVVFEKEVNIGEKVESYVETVVDEDGIATTRHQIQVEDTVKCTATFRWEKNNIVYNNQIENK